MNAAWQAYYRDRAEAEQRRRFPATGEDISTLDFAYTIAGCGRCAWRPQRVYKNGKLTVLQLGPGIHQGDVPALLVQSTQGEALVNYRIQHKRNKPMIIGSDSEAEVRVRPGADITQAR